MNNGGFPIPGEPVQYHHLLIFSTTRSFQSLEIGRASGKAGSEENIKHTVETNGEQLHKGLKEKNDS
jgi:hypothetical protein